MVYLPRGDYTAVVLQNQCSSPGCLCCAPTSLGSTGLSCLLFASLTEEEEEIIHLPFQRLHKLQDLDWLRQDVVVQSRSHSKLLIKTLQKLIWPLHSTRVIKAPAPGPAEPALKNTANSEKNNLENPQPFSTLSLLPTETKFCCHCSLCRTFCCLSGKCCLQPPLGGEMGPGDRESPAECPAPPGSPICDCRPCHSCSCAREKVFFLPICLLKKTPGPGVLRVEGGSSLLMSQSLWCCRVFCPWKRALLQIFALWVVFQPQYLASFPRRGPSSFLI